MPQILPLTPSVPSYGFATVLGGVTVLIDVRWNGRDAAWYLDLYAEDETPIRHGIKVLLGSPMGRRSISPLFPRGALIVVDTSGAGRDAGFDDLGTRVVVAFFTIAELQERATA